MISVEYNFEAVIYYGLLNMKKKKKKGQLKQWNSIWEAS